MQKITAIIDNQQGTVIIMAIVVLVMLSVIGIAATNTSTTEVQISTNAVLHNIAFYTADSGIEVGRAVLNNIKMADSGNWDNLLFNSSDPPPAVPRVITWNGEDCTTLDEIVDAEGGRTVGPTVFTLKIEDNDDLDGDPLVDTDDTVVLISELQAPFRNATATIRTTVRGGGTVYSQEHYDASSTGEAALESSAVSANVRW